MGIHVDDLKALNSKIGDELKYGQKIIISVMRHDNPEQKAAPTEKQKSTVTTEKQKQQGKTKYITYKVQPGDTLWRIANKHKGISIDEIKKWNNLKSENVVPGQLIKIVVVS